jgi:hypothetical protein
MKQLSLGRHSVVGEDVGQVEAREKEELKGD